MKDWESQPIQDDKMYQRWLSLDPDETGRTSTSVIARWKDMVSMFKYFSDMSSKLLIIDSSSVSMITRLLAQPAVQSGFICLTSNNPIIFNRGTKAIRRKLNRYELLSRQSRRSLVRCEDSLFLFCLGFWQALRCKGGPCALAAKEGWFPQDQTPQGTPPRSELSGSRGRG